MPSTRNDANVARPPRGLHPSHSDAATSSSEAVDKAYRFADLSGYSFKKRMLIRLADLGFFGLIQVLGRTARYEVVGEEHRRLASSDGQLPIYTFWHDGIVLSTYFWRRREIVVMKSERLDGESIGRLIQRFGYGAVCGSSSRGSVGAVNEMVRLMRRGKPAGFTIDGPKGPRHVAKLGAVLLAKKTGQPILPFVVTPLRAWHVRSWDRLQIPRPFTRARVEIAPPIHVPPDADEDAMEAYRLQLQAALDELNARGQAWRADLSG